MSQLTSNIIISCCQSYLPNSPSKAARPKLVGNYIVFTSFFPIIHCVSYFRFKSKEVEVSSCLAIIQPTKYLIISLLFFDDCSCYCYYFTVIIILRVSFFNNSLKNRFSETKKFRLPSILFFHKAQRSLDQFH